MSAKKVIVTIDTEGHDGKDPVNGLIWGVCGNGERHGIDEIMDIFDSYQIAGLFFVDIAEAWEFGEEPIRKVMTHIVQRGHNVGVHIHPDHMADKERLFLYQYSKEEQYQMIKQCTDFYEKVLGKKPLAFRAGKYGCNKDTLDILLELGYQADFSEFYGQKWCGLKPEITKNAAVFYRDKLMEIPVTAYQSFRFGNYSRCDKLDTDMAYSEFLYLAKRMQKQENLEVVVMFVHSFSLLKWRKNPDYPKYNRKKAKQLEKMLRKFKTSPAYELIGTEDIIEHNTGVRKQEEGDLMDISGRPASFVFFVFRVFRVLKMKLRIGT